MINRNGINDKKTNIILLLSALCAYVFVIFFLHRFMDCMLDSDDASELVLAKLLVNEGRIVTRSWYYSTEIRFFNTNLVYTFFMGLYKDWHLVRMCSVAVMLAGYMCGIRYLCTKVKCMFAFVAFALLIQTNEYFSIILKGAYYIPHILTLFLGLGLSCSFSKDRKRHKVLIAFVCFFLALAACLGGPRLVVILYLPLFLTALVLNVWYAVENKKKIYECGKYFRMLLISLISIAGAAVGYWVHSNLMIGFYHMKTWENLIFQVSGFGKFAKVMSGFANNYGYVWEKLSLKSVCCNGVALVSLVLTIAAVGYAFRKRAVVSFEYFFLAMFFLSGALILILLYFFTNMPYEARYNLPLTVLSWFLIALFFRHLKLPGEKKNVMILTYSAVLLFSAALFYGSLYDTYTDKDYKNEPKIIAEEMTENDYYYGYATFWNANILTELSDGKIEMYHWTNAGHPKTILRPDLDPSPQTLTTVTDVNQTFRWLQKVSHDKKRPHHKKVFVLLRREEIDYCTWKDRLSDDRIIYSSDEYVAYGYNEYEEMVSELNGGT